MGRKKPHTCVGKTGEILKSLILYIISLSRNQKCIVTEMSALKRGSLEPSKMTKTTYKTLFRSTHLKPFHAIWNKIWLVDWNRVNKLQIKCHKNGKSPFSVKCIVSCIRTNSVDHHTDKNKTLIFLQIDVGLQLVLKKVTFCTL